MFFVLVFVVRVDFFGSLDVSGMGDLFSGVNFSVNLDGFALRIFSVELGKGGI